MSRLEQIQRKVLFFLSTKTALQGYWELVGRSAQAIRRAATN